MTITPLPLGRSFSLQALQINRIDQPAQRRRDKAQLAGGHQLANAHR
jgi:hypothetical protein